MSAVEPVNARTPAVLAGEIVREHNAAQDAFRSVLPGAVTETALVLPDGLEFEAWAQVGERVGQMARACQWWIGDWINYGEGAYGEKYAQALDATGLEYSTVANYAWVAAHVEVSRRRETLSWSHHAEVAQLEPPEQDRWLAKAEAEGLSRMDLRREIKRDRLIESGEVKGTYRVFYADPPWDYGDDLIEGYGPAAHHYPSLPVAELCQLAPQGKPVVDLAGEDAVLFLWATSPLLPDALRVIEAWGFTYKASFVWDKIKHNYGHYNSVRHEFLLIATKGSCLPDSEVLRDSVVSLERTVHSEKPEQFREVIDEMYPSGARLELFARGDVPDPWDSWGAAA